MNTKVLRRLSSKIMIEMDGTYYVVKSRHTEKDHWNSTTYSSLKKALRKKHNMFHFFIREIGLFSYFKDRRITKVNRVRRKLVRKGKLKLAN